MDSTQVSANQVAAVFGMQPLVLTVVSFLIMAVTAWIKQEIANIKGWWLLGVPVLLGQIFAWLIPGDVTPVTRIRIGVICAVGATAIWGVIAAGMAQWFRAKSKATDAAQGTACETKEKEL